MGRVTVVASFGWARGDDVRVVFTFPDGVDVSGFSVVFTVKTRMDADPTDAAAVLSVPAVVEGPRSVAVVLTPAQSAIPADAYVWDLRIVDADGRVSHTETGVLAVRSVVTNGGV